VLAVGARTAKLLHQAGFRDVRSADGDAEALEALAASTLSPDSGPVLHACGATVTRSPLVALRRAGFDARELVLYNTVSLPGFDDVTLPSLGRVCTALVYSPGSARRLRKALEALPPCTVPPLNILGISEAALEPFDGAVTRCLRAATRPDEETLLKLLDEIGKKPVAQPEFRR
jgi:uroporphyrinogen-III synthase